MLFILCTVSSGIQLKVRRICVGFCTLFLLCKSQHPLSCYGVMQLSVRLVLPCNVLHQRLLGIAVPQLLHHCSEDIPDAITRGPLTKAGEVYLSLETLDKASMHTYASTHIHNIWWQCSISRMNVVICRSTHDTLMNSDLQSHTH